MDFTPKFRENCAAIGFDLEAFMATPPSTTADNRVKTFVYILGCEQFVKIGIAADVAKRVAGLQVGNPFLINVLRKAEYPSKLQALLVERTVHGVLAPHRLFSEWFTCEPTRARDALNYVAAAMRKLVPIHYQAEVERRRYWDERYATDPKLIADREASREWVAKAEERHAVMREAGLAFDRDNDFSPLGRL